MTTIADFTRTMTTDDDGTEIPRFTNFRAVIPLAESVRHGETQVTVRIEADDANLYWDDNKVTYLLEADLPGVHLGDDTTLVLPAALKSLTAEGFQLAGLCWTVTEAGYGARIEVAA